MIEQRQKGFAESRLGKTWNWVVPRNSSFRDLLLFSGFDTAVGVCAAYGIRAIQSGDVGGIILNAAIGGATLLATISTRSYIVVEKK